MEWDGRFYCGFYHFSLVQLSAVYRDEKHLIVALLYFIIMRVLMLIFEVNIHVSCTYAVMG